MTADDTVTAKLAEWEALVEGATEGPWVAEYARDFAHGPASDRVNAPEDASLFAPVCTVPSPAPNTAFICAARTAMPALLAAVQGVLRVCDERRGDCGDDYADGWTAGWADALLEVRRAITQQIGGEE